MKRHILSAITLCLGVMAWAQTPGDTILTLDQCIALALQNNAAIKSSDNSAAMARETSREALTKYFPQINAAGIGFRSHNYVLQYNALDLLNIELIKHGALAGVQALQPIFMGGQIVNGNKLAHVGEAVADLQRQQSQRQVKLTTEQHYWQLASLHASRQTLLQALQMLDTINAQVQVAVDAGVAMRNDLLKVELKRKDLRADLVDLDNGISLCRMVLSQYIGEDFTRPIDISAPVPDTLPPYPIGLHVDPTETLDKTIDYQLLGENVRAKTLERRMALGKLLPTVAGGGGWYYHNLLEQGHGFGALELMVNIPISDWWGGSHALKRKKLEEQNARIERDDLGQMLQIKMQDAWDNLTAAHRKMQLAGEAIAQADENLRINRLYYEAGTGTVTDLLDAQTLQRQARDRYTTAYGAYRTAMAQYLDATAR